MNRKIRNANSLSDEERNDMLENWLSEISG